MARHGSWPPNWVARPQRPPHFTVGDQYYPCGLVFFRLCPPKPAVRCSAPEQAPHCSACFWAQGLCWPGLGRPSCFSHSAMSCLACPVWPGRPVCPRHGGYRLLIRALGNSCMHWALRAWPTVGIQEASARSRRPPRRTERVAGGGLG